MSPPPFAFHNIFREGRQVSGQAGGLSPEEWFSRGSIPTLLRVGGHAARREGGAMNRSDVLTAAGLGAMAGMRSLSAPAFLSHRLSRDDDETSEPLEEVLSSKASAGTLAVMALGELVADKLPVMPSRLSPPALAMRLASGAFAGATMARRHKRPVLGAALIGAVAALVSSFALYSVRRFATQRLRIPNVIAGFLEDALVANVGMRLTEALE